MKKLAVIKQVCEEVTQDHADLIGQYDSEEAQFVDQGRAELAQEILEILNGENE